jgi:hypothetical protein
MNVFNLIKTVLDDEYAEMSGSEKTKNATIRARLDDLQDCYKRLTHTPPKVDYGDPATRLAYVFRYVTSHAHLVANEIRRCDALVDVLDKERVAVACVGGGPGSDFLGLLEYMMGRDYEGTLRCYLLDKESGWGDAWSDVGERVASLPFSVFTHFQECDVTKKQTWHKQKKYLKVDLFTMIYFISEIFAIKAQAEAFFDHLYEEAQPGALFLFIDNDADTFTSWFDDVAERNGLELLHSKNRDARLPGSEQKDDLEPYVTLFGFPKIKAKIAVRVYQKPV